MKEVEIKDISGKVRFSTPINKGAKGKFTLMKEDYIILPFSVAKPIAFKMGDYVDLSEVLDESLGGKLSKIYEIVDLQKPTYNSSTGGYDYELKLDAYYWKWKNKIFKYTPENAGSEASWTLTAGLDVQLGVFLRNLKALGYTYKGKDYVFEIDSTVENKAVAMTYDNINLLDALFSMAGEDKWNCDCWVEENVIHFGRNEFGDAVKIERDIEASSITRSESQGTYATRIYAFGGTRNIPNNYGKKFIDSVSFIQGNVRFTGLLSNTNYYLEDGADVQIRFLTGPEENKVFPVHWTAGNFYFEDGTICKAVVGDRFELLNFPDNVPDKYLSFSTEDLVVNGVVQKRLMMPADTPYIDVYPDMSQEEAVESIVVFDDIYPKRIGTMSDVNTVPSDIKEDDKVVGTFDAYQYKDAGLVFDKKYQIEGTELKITFQSGKMNGMEFEVIFDPNDKDEQLWEIVRNEDYGRPLPDEYIHPENGDQYVLSGFNIKLVSDQYIPSAEQELKERAQKYADKTKIDDGTYPVTLRSDWVKENLILRTFGFGQRINLVDDTFFENGRISRVLGWEMNLDIPWDSPVYTIGESMPYSRIGELEEKVDSLIYNGQTYNGNYGGGGSYVYVIKTNDSTSPTDSNVFSALRSLATFLRKDKPDAANEIITFNKGAKFGNFRSGTLGSGGSVSIDENGGSHAEFDYLTVRKKALFTEVTIQELKHIGGSLIISPASMVISKVEETSNGYKCYFATTDNDGRKIYNQFEVGDQARCQTFNLEELGGGLKGNRYWWRLVTGVGEDYIVLSKTDADKESDMPAVGDNVSQLGNRTDASRQNAQIYSAYGDDAPSRVMYQGINSYSLDGKAIKYEGYDITTNRFKEETYGDAYFGDKNKSNFMSYSTDNGVEVKGKVTLGQGSAGAGNITDLPEEITKAVSVGSENLLRNTGFLGNYNPKDLKGADDLTDDTEMYSESLEYWSGDAIVMQDSESLSGYAAKIYSLTQSVTLIPNEKYTISYKAKNGTISFNVGGSIVSNALTSEYKRYNHTVTASDSTFEIYGGGTVCEIKLERGTIATDWCPSVLDPAPVKDMFKDLWYLQSAMQGSTTTIGGLNLTSVILLGQFLNGEMQKVNAGVSGIYNDNDDVAFWAGGSLEEAIKTVQKLKDGYTPTDTEWNSLAKFVATHGGDLFLRGYIYALGGLFRGRVEAGNNERKVIINPQNGSLEFYYMGKKRIDILYGQKLGSTSAISVNMYDEQGKNTAWMNQYGFYSKIAEDDQYEIVSVSNSEGVSFLKYPKTGIGRAGMIAKLGITVNEENVQLSKLFIYGDIPTSSDLLTLGQVYQEDGFLKVKTE